MGLLSEMIRVQRQQEQFERVHYYEFEISQISAEHIEILKNKGELLVGCLKPSCIYKLTYNKENQETKIEHFRGGINGTAAFAGWTHENLMNYMCGGIVYEQDLLETKRRPEEEIIALEKDNKKQLRNNDIKFYLSLLALVSFLILPFVLSLIRLR